MYIKDQFHQLGLADFNQPIGLKMNPENRWIKKAETIPWFAIEDRYAQLFPMPVKPLRAALGSLIIECNHRMTSRRKAAKDLPIPNPWKPKQQMKTTAR